MKKEVNENRKFLKDRLGYIRNRANMSARELSLILDKSIAYIAKFDNGDFEMPSETLLKAIELCGSTPEEFFFRNIGQYAEVKDFIELFLSLSDNNKQTIIDLMNNLK